MIVIKERLTTAKTSAVVLLLLLFAFTSISASSENPGPVEIGGKCYESDSSYHSLNFTRTPWKVNELYAVPIGTTDPLTWEEHSSFKTQLLQNLKEPKDAQAFAESCGSIWKDFFSSLTDVVINVQRTVSGVDDVLECQSDMWTFTRSQNIDQTDTSEWLQLGSFDVTKDSSTSELQQRIQSILDQLNSQAGALPADE